MQVEAAVEAHAGSATGKGRIRHRFQTGQEMNWPARVMHVLRDELK